MPNGTYGGVRGKETKVGQKTFVSRPTRLHQQCSVHPRRIYCTVGRVIRLSLDEEALCVAVHEEQVGAFCIGG